eukprot:s724_g30.t1
MAEPLTGRKDIEEVDEHNSLRNVHCWICPRMKFIGKQIQNLIQRWLNNNPNVQTELLSSLGKQAEISEAVKILLQQLRGEVRDLLGRNRHPEMTNTCSIEQVSDGTYETEIRGDLLHYWSLCVDDPGQHTVRWLMEGAPAGLVCNTEALDGVFPRVDNTRAGDYHELVTEYATFANYSGVEDNEEAIKALKSYADKGYLKKFDSLRDLEKFVQSVVSTPLHVGSRTEEARFQTYVDDPLFSIRGSSERARQLATIIMVSWTILGFPLAFHKATLAPKLTWIGVELSINTSGIEAVVPQEKVQELTELLQQMLQSNIIPKKTMRTAVGKAMSIASILFCWRPFLQELYVALHTEDTKAPRECIWTKQVRHTLIWLLTFLSGEMAGIRRQYTVRCLSHHLPLVTITWDASPWGMGATLQLDGSTVEYFSIPISGDDEMVLDTKSGTHEGQQVWEALAGLIAFRQWTKYWFGQRARLQIRSDNVGALTILTKLKGGSRQLSLLAREYASEAFDLYAVEKVLEGVHSNLSDEGPIYPLPMVVCATYFMLRELEASAVDRADVMFGDESVTLALPVSKTDWEAKGYSRTWSCICDRRLPCPFHILKEHCEQLDLEGRSTENPLFPDRQGNYCTKAGVGQTIRIAAQRSGMEVTDPDGGHRLSGHTFRIIGARFLSAAGLDPITIQLLGRWGSNAVLTYLAESPLMSLKHRLKPLESQRLDQVRRDGPPVFGYMDARAHAEEMLDLDRKLQDQMTLVKDHVNTLTQRLDQHADQLQGISLVLNSGTDETWKVINTKSRVEHSTTIRMSSSPHSWKTKCGWNFAGKKYAETFSEHANLIHTYKMCPKCHQLPDDETDTSSSLTDTDD